jgi:hypothetical protein
MAFNMKWDRAPSLLVTLYRLERNSEQGGQLFLGLGKRGPCPTEIFSCHWNTKNNYRYIPKTTTGYYFGQEEYPENG